MNGLKALIIRHRFTMTDMSMMAIVVAAALFGAWQYDVFPNETPASRDLMFELDEIFAISTLAFALFSWSRLRAQKREILRRRAAEEAARVLAFEDTLTGLPNRRKFEDALNAALKSPPGADATHALMILDLNGFKQINDVYGHPVGDEVLIQTAMRLRGAVREPDMVARLGGDEFAVLARHLSGTEAVANLAVRVIEMLNIPIQSDAGEHPIGTGIGIALFPSDGEDIETLMRKADVALYRAKSEGGSTLRFFEEDMDRVLRERDRLERDLRKAIGTSALQLNYQPTVNLGSGQIRGFEAVPRWLHDDLGALDFSRMGSIAETARLTRELTDDLLRKACRDAANWPALVTLTFPITSSNLKDTTFGLRILKILSQTGLAPSRLELEIPESTLVAELDAAQHVLGGIHASGVRIALSQFGTGYSSLYHLRNFHLDTVKIDRSFVQGMSSNPKSASIVRALVGLGAGLGITVSAEGLQDAEQHAMLSDQGCQQAQLFQQAVSPDQALSLTAERLVAKDGQDARLVWTSHAPASVQTN